MVGRSVDVGFEGRIADHVGIVNLREGVSTTTIADRVRKLTKIVHRLTRTNKEMKRTLWTGTM